jgi:hypothetical protein
VHVCTDKEEWTRVIFFNSYGDLGMILGLIARNVGLQLGIKGLKVHNAINVLSYTKIQTNSSPSSGPQHR